MLEMKIARHAQIIKLINQYDIETQEQKDITKECAMRAC